MMQTPTSRPARKTPERVSGSAVAVLIVVTLLSVLLTYRTDLGTRELTTATSPLARSLV